jgi:peptidyl-prolyl cis-trans isomerase B (cyclophilin B)
VASTRNRQRALARAKLERQMARRAATARKRRQVWATIGAVAAVLVVLGGVGAIVWANSGSDKKAKPKAAASPTPSASAASDGAPKTKVTIKTLRVSAPTGGSAGGSPAKCTYTKVSGSNPNLKDVGIPKASGVPHSGTQTMTISTNLGDINVNMDLSKAPCNAASFAYLASKKFFDNTICHRLTTKASGLEVLQCGDPSGTGSGGPTYTVNDENLPTGKKPTYPAGTVAVANTGKAHTGSSQFFIVYGDSDLPASYSVLGTVSKGLDIVKNVAKAGAVANPTGAS